MSNSDNTLSIGTFPWGTSPISPASIRARTLLSIAALTQRITADSIESMDMTTDITNFTDAPRPKRQKDDPRFAAMLYLPALTESPAMVLGEVERLKDAVVAAAKSWYAVCDPNSISAPEVRAAGVVLGNSIEALKKYEGC